MEIDEFRHRIELKINSIDKTINGNGREGVKDRLTSLEVHLQRIESDIRDIKSKPATPCDVHSARMDGMCKQVAWVWSLMVLNIGAIGTGFWIMLRLKGGS